MFILSYLNIIFISYFLGALCVLTVLLTRKNIVLLLICIELFLLCINLYFIVYSVYLDNLVGQIFALFILTVAAAESAIGLAILVSHHKLCFTLSIDSINLLKG